MKNKLGSRSHLCQIFGLFVVIVCVAYATQINPNQHPEILVRRLSHSNSNEELHPKILKLTQNGPEEVTEIYGEPLFTLKSDPVKVQSDFKTVDITVLNKLRDKENAKKVAIVQEDLQSRIKINEAEPKIEEPLEKVSEFEPVDPVEMMRKQARVKEDIESRVLSDDGILGFRQHGEREEKIHYPVKRSDNDYYADEPERYQKSKTTTEAAKEEDSFFSIFESLFGSSDDDSETKKKSKPEEELLFSEPDDPTIKENIKTVGDILKPLKPADKMETKTQSVGGFQSDSPEYRIVNNFHASQFNNRPAFKPSESKPNYNYYRPTEKIVRPYAPYSTNGYEDYDLEEFLDKEETTTSRVKYIPPITTAFIHADPTTITTTTTSTTTTLATPTTTIKVTSKSAHDNKLKFPSIQKKNDYINRNRYQEVKNEITEKSQESVTEKTTYRKPEIKTTTEFQHFSNPGFETKINEVKPQKIQESPNFYNLINLPVRYSTKDTAIPLISTSYANTKIQGMGAYKHDKGTNGKYPNHKYDQVHTSTTKRPNYWATKRTSTEQSISTYRPSSLMPKTTIKYNFDKTDFENMPMGLGPEFGGYGSKTSVDIKTQTPVSQATAAFYKDITTKSYIKESTSQEPQQKLEKITQSEKLQKTTPKLTKDEYEEYEYENFPAHVQEIKPDTNPNYFPVNFVDKKDQTDYKTQYKFNENSTTLITPVESQKPEILEYEYYDYEDQTATTTTTPRPITTTTTSKYKIKYPSLAKEKIKTSSSEKVAVVVPSKEHDFYGNESEIVTTKEKLTTAQTTTTTTTSPTTSTTTTEAKIIEPEVTTQYRKITTPFHRLNYKEPAPVFEDVKEEEEYTVKDVTTRKSTTDRLTTQSTVKPVVVTSSNNDHENNVNIVLVPTKETIKAEEKYSPSETQRPSIIGLNHKQQTRPNGSYQPGFDYTTEFTVGVVHGSNGGAQIYKPSVQNGHFVASSISTNPYGDDEPFRPIPNPPGIQVVHENVQKQPHKNPIPFQNKRPIPAPHLKEETEPIHEPHEFIPSPQFHRPNEPKPQHQRPGGNLDYDFDGIQTEPKPGQYVIFSKPQLNPEMNENQLKKKPEVNAPTKTISNIPHYHEKVGSINQGIQKPFKEVHVYQNLGKPKPSASEVVEQGRPIYGNLPEISDERLSLELVPPRGTQTEKPFEGNFVSPEKDKQDSSVSYPRPHWEKNGKPSFLLNKNDLQGSRLPPIPPQMVPTLIPPTSAPPQRFRRPIPHMPPLRKNFNEAGTNVKPKPNLPNILPQFRPNAKVGTGPYHRPPGYVSSNRRNGINRYHDKEHGSFPYHIQHPDKDTLIHREYEMGPEIIPKFITNRGKLPSELWNPQNMQKRFGQGPVNINSRSEILDSPDVSSQKILRRLQRTPVTTLQMLKQMPGVKTQKTQITREDSANPPPLLPPIYKTFVDQPKVEENLYIVYPAKAPQKLRPDNDKVFIVSDTKSQKNFYNFTKLENQYPLLNPNKRGNPSADKSKGNFPYGFIKPDERIKLNRKSPKENEEKNIRLEDESATQEYKTYQKDEKIDMNLHLQSNNQWNEVKTTKTDSMDLVRSSTSEKIPNEYYRFSEKELQSEKDGVRVNPPSEYHTSIKDEGDSAFTLGAVMHTMSEMSRKGQVTNVDLRDEEKDKKSVPKLSVNERISNGKIVTVSMPLDVKQESQKEEGTSQSYQFQAPFQASSSITLNESEPGSQGWSIVKNPDDKSDSEREKEISETSTNPQFSFENFKPELIGGFKPIYELPDEFEGSEEPEKTTDRQEKKLQIR